jgi:hypothetical protein
MAAIDNITMYDIAQEAGVSPAAGSRVLTKKARVSAGVRKLCYTACGLMAAGVRNPCYTACGSDLVDLAVSLAETGNALKNNLINLLLIAHDSYAPAVRA